MTARFDFSGKTVLVTGASRGIGLAVATAFARAGAHLYVLAEDQGIHEAAERIAGETGARVSPLECDVADRSQVSRALEAVTTLDVLVSNAGLERPTPLAEPGPEIEATFHRIMAVNVAGTYNATRQVLASMGAGGRIVITASIWGKTAVADFSAYCASKHALVGLTRSWARELGPAGITVNAVCPGWVETEASVRSLRAMAEKERRTEGELLEAILAAQALPDLMKPADIAETYLFLASDAAANITGQAINVDRGEVLS